MGGDFPFEDGSYTYGNNASPIAWGYIGFAFGLFGGILAFRRSYWLVAMFCAVLVMICGVLTLLSKGTRYEEKWVTTPEGERFPTYEPVWEQQELKPVNIAFGLVTFALALISTTFLAICRSEFAKAGLSPKGI
jgi:hypothetical protein